MFNKIVLPGAAMLLFLVFIADASACAPMKPPAGTAPNGVTPAAEPGPTQTAASPVSDTAKTVWKVVENANDGFTVSVPVTWKENVQARDKFLLFYADPVKPPEGATRNPGSFSVAKKPLNQPTNLDDLAAAALRSFSSNPSLKLIGHQRLNLAAGDSVKFDFQREFTREAGQIETMLLTEYFLLRGTDAYIFTFETYPAMSQKYLPIYQEIAASFRFTR